MTLWNLIHRSLRQHALSTLVTAASIALAAGLLMTVWMIKTQAQATFAQTNSGFDAVLGARSSKMQLVLNAIFHLEASPGNVGAADVENIRRHPAVKTAIPIAVGDNYHGWRIVGTVPQLFSDIEYVPGRTHQFAEGRVFAEGEHEAVVGSFAARKLGLSVGDTFTPYHGFVHEEHQQHEETYQVVGVLEPTNSPVDRVIWIPLEGVQTMEGHDEARADEVSAVLIQLRAPTAGVMLDMMINRQGDRLTFAYPIGAVVADLFNKIGWFDRVLALLAVMVAAVAAGSVMASIYNSIGARQRDIAILRALGARRRTIFGLVVGEAATIGLLGSLAGFLVYGVLASIATSVVRAQTGVVLDPASWHPIMAWAPVTITALCMLVGVLPAVRAYRIPVASTLAPLS